MFTDASATLPRGRGAPQRQRGACAPGHRASKGGVQGHASLDRPARTSAGLALDRVALPVAAFGPQKGLWGGRGMCDAGPAGPGPAKGLSQLASLLPGAVLCGVDK
jgi:hypothetical protein